MKCHHNLTSYLAYPPTPIDPWTQTFCGMGYFVEFPPSPHTTRVWVCDMLCALCVKNVLKKYQKTIITYLYILFKFILVYLLPFWTFLHPCPVISTRPLWFRIHNMLIFGMSPVFRISPWCLFFHWWNLTMSKLYSQWAPIRILLSLVEGSNYCALQHTEGQIVKYSSHIVSRLGYHAYPLIWWAKKLRLIFSTIGFCTRTL